MFCPQCQCEFRAGFSRCETCGVDLVEDLSAPRQAPRPEPSRPVTATPVPMSEYCGFLSLDEARNARDRVRELGIQAAIEIREAPGSPLDEPSNEEFWLRVEASKIGKAAAVLGYDTSEAAADEEEYVCGNCNAVVGADDDACPACGERLEGD